jgi:hypothetical protein
MSWYIARSGAMQSGFLRPGAVLAANLDPDAPAGSSIAKLMAR